MSSAIRTSSVSNSENVQFNVNESILMVGNTQVAQELAQLVLANGSTVKVEADSTNLTDDLVFGRDSRVVDLSGRHLFPYPIKDDVLQNRFRALLPESSNKFVINYYSGYGNGFLLEHNQAAKVFAEQNGLESKQMLSCVEGGNCFIFPGEEREPKAIIGIHSLILTMIALEDQNYFASHLDDLQVTAATIQQPSRDAVRAVRNRVLYQKKRRVDLDLKRHRDCQSEVEHLASAEEIRALSQEFSDLVKRNEEWGGETGYRKLLATSVTVDEETTYAEEAKIWEAKLLMAKEIIAADLEIPLKNIAFVPQQKFHIDMELFISPNRQVCVDEASYQPALVAALKTIDCQIISLPGVHELNGQVANFMNGVFISCYPQPLFVTNGVKSRHSKFARAFSDAFQQANIPAKLVLTSEKMQEILNRNGGGIHCLTWEKRLIT